MRIRMLTAFAVLFLASAAFAENLPPVPKCSPTPAPKQEISTATIKIATQVEPAPAPPKDASCEPAQMPAAPKTCEVPKVETCESAPLPPVLACDKVKDTTQAACDLKGQVKTCRHVVGTSVKFVGNEFVRKPVFEIEKALHEAEAKRLEREAARLNQEADTLSSRSTLLANEIKLTDPNDLHKKLLLVKKEREFAKQVNNLAVHKAALELKLAEHSEKCKKLAEKDDKLYNHAD